MTRQVDRVVINIRELIIGGKLAPGERIAEIPLAERLGVSRMPVRLAFKILAAEGLLEQNETRGYRVRPFRDQEVNDALEVRGALEGLAARLLAEAGMSRVLRQELQECLDRGDAIFESGRMTEEDAQTYSEMNLRFHAAVLEGSRNPVITRALALNNHLPFSSAGSIAFDSENTDREYRRFLLAHAQHHIIFQAIEKGQGQRAAAAMQEHANSGINYARLFRRETPAGDSQQYEVVHATRLTL
jgi:GntR family transcriptional regulator of vanillate catabolism